MKVNKITTNPNIVKKSPSRLKSVALGLALTGIAVGAFGNTGNKTTATQPETYVTSPLPQRNIKPQQVSHSQNSGVNKRSEIFYDDYERDELYNRLGTYGATMEMQRYVDMQRAMTLTFPVMSKTQLGSSEAREYMNKSRAYDGDLRTYKESSKSAEARLLHANGIATGDICSNYIDRTIANMNISQADYSRYQRDVERFKNAQGQPQTTEKYAELIAYKQFKKDSIVVRSYLEKYGFLQDKDVVKKFESEYCPKVSPKP